MHSLPCLPDEDAITPMLSGLAANEAQEVIDRRILQHAECIRSLHSLRNKQTKVCSLPPEVLSMIFITAVEPESDFCATRWRHHVQLTAVCRFWRTLALQTPAFWSCIPLGNWKNLPEMIARSKSHPFSVRLRHHIRISPSAFSKIHDRLTASVDVSRLGEFHFTGRLLTEDHCYWAKPPHVKAPFLHSLKLSSLSARTLHVPSQVLSIAYPRLRHLHLSRVEFDWASLPGRNPGITNLTSVYLGWQEPGLPGAFLWSIISSSPKLESLTLNFPFTVDFDFEPPIALAGSFPKLHFVDIKCPFKSAALLLLGIGPPPNSHITLEIADRRTVLQDTDKSLLTALLKTSRFSNKNETVLKTQQLMLTVRSDMIILYLGASERSDKHGNWVPEIRLVRLPPATITVILEAYCVQGLRTLDIRLFRYHPGGLTSAEEGLLPTPAQWRHFFGEHPSIVELQFKYSAKINAVISSLTPSLLPSTDFSAPFVLPQLQSIDLEGVHMTANEVEDFKFMIYTRSKHQLFLKTLNIADCRGFLDLDVSRMRERLGQWRTNVHWDYRECSDDESDDIDEESSEEE